MHSIVAIFVKERGLQPASVQERESHSLFFDDDDTTTLIAPGLKWTGKIAFIKRKEIDCEYTRPLKTVHGKCQDLSFLPMTVLPSKL